MPRTLKPAPTRRAKAPKARGNVFEALEPKILSPEEKRELIKAHAEARIGQDRGFSIGYVIAIAASTLMIGTGWMMSFGRGIWLSKPPAPDAAIETIKETAESVRTDVTLFKDQLEERKNAEQATTTNP